MTGFNVLHPSFPGRTGGKQREMGTGKPSFQYVTNLTLEITPKKTYGVDNESIHKQEV